MQTTELVKSQVEQVHATALQALDGLTDEQLHRRLPGATINPIAGVFVHLVTAEDRFVMTTLQGKPRLFDGGWSARLGLAEAEREHRFEDFHMHDRPAFMEYATAVFAATERYLTSARPDDLDRLLKLGAREMTAALVLARLVAGHGLMHAGEMAALRGAMGLGTGT